MCDGELAHQPGAAARLVGSAGPVSSASKGSDSSGPAGATTSDFDPFHGACQAAEGHLVELQRISRVEYRQAARCQFDAGAYPPHKFGDLLDAAVDAGDRDGAVTQQEHPAILVAERDRSERLSRMQRGEHVRCGNDLLHQLAIVGRGCLQCGVGIGQRGLCIGDLLVQIRVGRGLRDVRALALHLGQFVAPAIEVRQLG